MKGAYAESPEVVLHVKADVDQAFFDQSVRMLVQWEFESDWRLTTPA